jgi:cardiolipin synthase
MSGPRTRPRGDIEATVRRIFAPHLAAPERQRFWETWRGTLRLLRPLGAVTLGNRIEVLADGDLAFEAMWQAVDEARRSVVLNTYILENDRVGERTIAGLTAAARRGCAVTLIFDSFGSHRLDRGALSALVEAGGRVLAYNPMLRRRSRLSRLVRNHWKILVCDDIGFCGGMNIAEEYAGERHGKNLFRDTQLRLEGPCVFDLAALLDSLILEMTRNPCPKRARSEPIRDGRLVQILESNIRRQRRAIQRALRFTIVRAVERCYLTTPYFVPPRRVVSALCQAAMRGVDVRVLTAGRSDIPVVHLASQHLYGRLLRSGVRIYEMVGRNLHAKTTTIDRVYSSVGSFNIDYWSYRRNLEVSVSALDTHLAKGIEARFREDLESSREVSLATWERRPWFKRCLHWLALQAMRI